MIKKEHESVEKKAYTLSRGELVMTTSTAQ
jgi:hypothetical protein